MFKVWGDYKKEKMKKKKAFMEIGYGYVITSC